MHRIRLDIKKAGPIRNTSIEFTIPGVTLFIGSNISGKTLVGSLLTISLSLSLHKHRDFIKELEFEDDIHYLTSLVNSSYDVLGLLQSTEYEEMLDIIKSNFESENPEKMLYRYLYLLYILSELGGVYRLDELKKLRELVSEKETLSCTTSIDYVREAEINIKIPIHRFEDLLDQYVDVNEKPTHKILGLALIDPYNAFYRIYLRERYTPSETLVDLITDGSRRIDPWILDETSRILRKSLQLSGLPGNVPVKLITTRTGINLKIFDKVVEPAFFSKGLRTLLAHMVYSYASYILARNYEVKPIVFLDEPETSLDTYILYMLPKVIYRHVIQQGLLVISTHSIEILHSVELMVSKNELDERQVIVYEVRWKDSSVYFEKVEFDKALERYNVKRLENIIDYIY